MSDPAALDIPDLELSRPPERLAELTLEVSLLQPADMLLTSADPVVTRA